MLGVESQRHREIPRPSRHHRTPHVEEAEDEQHARHDDEDPSEYRSRLIRVGNFVVQGQVWRVRWCEMVEEGHPGDIGIVQNIGSDPCGDTCGERHQRQHAHTPGAKGGMLPAVVAGLRARHGQRDGRTALVLLAPPPGHHLALPLPPPSGTPASVTATVGSGHRRRMPMYPIQLPILAYAFVAAGSHCAGEVQLKAINVGWRLVSGGNANTETAALSMFRRGSLSSGMPM
jgi:hypothetical protein